MAANNTHKTTFLIISDTHGEPLAEASNRDKAYREGLPKVDVVLHCGDMTLLGGLAEYEAGLEMLGKLHAELKLVIAGNHDISLDEEFYQIMGPTVHKDQYTRDTHRKAKKFWKLKAARVGVTYLDEGVHTFQLDSGAKFSIYASPYQPGSSDWAFQYRGNQDRFNPEGCKTLGHDPNYGALNPVPSSGIDIMMTHGPPLGHLDELPNGAILGCRHLQRAAQRAQPRLYCFGHIHEGYGAERITWSGKKTEWDVDSSVSNRVPLESETWKNDRREPNYVDITAPAGEETLMVNAAILDGKYNPVNAPWIVSIDLEKNL